MIWMIDTKEALRAFKDKIDSMSQEERKQYYEEMGFVFEPTVDKGSGITRKFSYSPKNSDKKNFLVNVLQNAI